MYDIFIDDDHNIDDILHSHCRSDNAVTRSFILAGHLSSSHSRKRRSNHFSSNGAAATAQLIFTKWPRLWR